MTCYIVALIEDIQFHGADKVTPLGSQTLVPVDLILQAVTSMPWGVFLHKTGTGASD